MLGLKRLWGIVLLLAWAGVVGCGGKPATPTTGPTPASRAPNPQAVLEKLQALSDEGRRRYSGDSQTHAEVSAWYLAELDAIDLGGCPEEFAESFHSYRQAWDAVRQRSQTSPEDKSDIKSFVYIFTQIKDDLSWTELSSGRDDLLLNTILIRVRELKRAARK
jgi:hypothetical protein